MVTENSVLSQRYEALTVELQPEGGKDLYPGWGGVKVVTALWRLWRLPPPLGLSQSHPTAYLGSPHLGQCYGLCEVTMTQNSQPMRPLLMPTQWEEQGGVLSKEELSSDPPPWPGNNLAQMKTDPLARIPASPSSPSP